MLNNEDIQKIIQAEQNVFVTKDDLENFREEVKKMFFKLLTKTMILK